MRRSHYAILASLARAFDITRREFIENLSDSLCFLFRGFPRHDLPGLFLIVRWPCFGAQHVTETIHNLIQNFRPAMIEKLRIRDESISVFYQRMDDALAVDQHFDLRLRNIEEPPGFDDLQPLVHQGGRVDGDLGTHGPVGMLQGVRRRHMLQLLEGARQPVRCHVQVECAMLSPTEPRSKMPSARASASLISWTRCTRTSVTTSVRQIGRAHV